MSIEMEKVVKKWNNYSFISSSEETKEFRSFRNAFKRAFVKDCEKEKIDLLTFAKGHFDFFGFIKNPDTGNYAYFSLLDVRCTHNVLGKILYRTAKTEKDYTGGINQYTDAVSLAKQLKRITSI